MAEQENRFPTKLEVHLLRSPRTGDIHGYQVLPDPEGQMVSLHEYEQMRSYCVRLVETKTARIAKLEAELDALNAAITLGGIVPDARPIPEDCES